MSHRFTTYDPTSFVCCRPWTRLWAKLLEFHQMVLVQHRYVALRLTEMRKRLIERLVPTLKNVDFRVAKRRVRVDVRVAITITKESRSTTHLITWHYNHQSNQESSTCNLSCHITPTTVTWLKHILQLIVLDSAYEFWWSVLSLAVTSSHPESVYSIQPRWLEASRWRENVDTNY